MQLFKKGSMNKSESYRPVNLTSVEFKSLKPLIRVHMVECLVKQMNKYISTWVPKSKVMYNQSIGYTLQSEQMMGHQWMLFTFFNKVPSKIVT